VDLEVGEGEVVALLGPNGSGKSTLLHTIMGRPGYEVVSGRILFNGIDVTGMRPDERARLGMGFLMQLPPAMRGVRLRDLLKRLSGIYGVDMDRLRRLAEELRVSNLLDRDLHRGFSGGEMKRVELLLLAAQSPRLALLDEPDSGVDLESLPLLGRVISELVEAPDGRARERRAAIIVTHAGKILSYVRSANRAYIMLDGRISCFGNPRDLIEDVERYGFEGCLRCLKVV
ncbi:MAG: ABC transporter ATP-binding protein, partial [Candidatus Korarchaeota archaeon NZ13-K]